jgi:hypothetical protein
MLSYFGDDNYNFFMSKRNQNKREHLLNLGLVYDSRGLAKEDKTMTLALDFKIPFDWYGVEIKSESDSESVGEVDVDKGLYSEKHIGNLLAKTGIPEKLAEIENILSELGFSNNRQAKYLPGQLRQLISAKILGKEATDKVKVDFAIVENFRRTIGLFQTQGRSRTKARIGGIFIRLGALNYEASKPRPVSVTAISTRLGFRSRKTASAKRQKQSQEAETAEREVDSDLEIDSESEDDSELEYTDEKLGDLAAAGDACDDIELRVEDEDELEDLKESPEEMSLAQSAVEHAKDRKEELQQAKNSAQDVFTRQAFSAPATRSDMRPRKVICNAWQQISTHDTFGKAVMVRIEHGGYVMMKTQVLQISPKEYSPEFLKTEAYQNYLIATLPAVKPIGKTLFLKFRPENVVRTTVNNCVDVTITEVFFCIQALQRWITMPAGGLACSCPECQGEDIQAFHAARTTNELFAYLLCPAYERPEMQRRKDKYDRGVVTREQAAAAAAQYAEKRKRAHGEDVKCVFGPRESDLSPKLRQIKGMQADHSGGLVLPPRRCCESECEKCGVDKRIRDVTKKCSHHWSATSLISYKKYQNVAKESHAGRVSKEVVVFKESMARFMDHFCSVAKKFVSHFFQKKWDYCYRMNSYHDVANQIRPGASVNIATDYSSVYVIQGQDTVTGAVGENMMQFVVLVSHGLPATSQLDTTCKHFWGVKREGKLICSGSFHVWGCLRQVLSEIKEKGDIDMRTLTIELFSDGCGGEQKQRKSLYEAKMVCIAFCLAAIICTYAPTACFKWLCDISGYVGRQLISKQLKLGLTVANDNVSIYNLCCEVANKHPVASLQIEDAFFKQSAREHYLTVDIDEKDRIQKKLLDLGKIASVDDLDPHVLYFDAARQEINCKPVAGIQSQRQAIVNSDSNDMTVKLRTLACLCTHCVSGEYNQCLQMEECGQWVSRKLVQVPLVPKSDKTQSKEAKKAAAAASLIATSSSSSGAAAGATPPDESGDADSIIDTDDEREGEVCDFPIGGE